MAKEKPDHWYKQSGVVPCRVRDGRLEVLLITSQSKGHWIVPKGIVEQPLSPADSALKEALEEAGVEGRVVGDELGVYEQAKWGGTCRVRVFAMHVERELGEWPERKVRQRQWLPLDQAIAAVANRDLARIIAKLVDHQLLADG
jgi:8-oxo-dGTP pyrophosphatase MutT (NUDIX family)